MKDSIEYWQGAADALDQVSREAMTGISSVGLLDYDFGAGLSAAIDNARRRAMKKLRKARKLVS